MEPRSSLVLGQVALISDQVDVHEASRWYERVLGFLPSNWTDKFGGPDLANLQGLPEPDTTLTICWLVERNDTFQLELFAYQKPVMRPRPADWSPRDIGYASVTLHVTDFDSAVARARDLGSLNAGPAGPDGDRRAVLHDPNGTVIELLERDIPVPGAGPSARPDVGVAVRAITASVPDLSRSVSFFGDAFGLETAHVATLHEAHHFELLGVGEGQRQTHVFQAGEIFLELVQYAEPTGAPRDPERLLSDAGIMNIALTTTNRDVYNRMLSRVTAAGHASREFVPNEDVAVSYVTDEDGFNVELLFMAPAAYADFGYVPFASDAGIVP